MPYPHTTRPPVRARDMSAMHRFTGQPDITWVGVTLFEGTLASA